MMYDLSACSATKANDGNFMEDLFSWETVSLKKNKHGTYKLYICQLLLI